MHVVEFGALGEQPTIWDRPSLPHPHSDEVLAIAISEDGNILATGAACPVSVRRAGGSPVSLGPTTHLSSVSAQTAQAWHREERSDVDNMVHVYNLPQQTLLHEFAIQQGGVQTLLMLSNNIIFAVRTALYTVSCNRCARARHVAPKAN